MHLSALLLSVLAGATLTAGEPAALRFSGMFSDHAVLPRDRPVPVWGFAPPGQAVTVTIAGATATATAGADGRWMANVGPLAAGGPYELTADGGGQVTIRDILIGEVWLCMGQSNMQFTLAQAAHEAPTIAAAADGQLRVLTLGLSQNKQPQADIAGGAWTIPGPDSAGKVSALAYHFAREMRQRLGIPVGVVVSAWGGTAIQQWMRPEVIAEAVRQTPAIDPAVRQTAERQLAQRRESWFAANDPGVAAKPSWADPAFDDAAWLKLLVPGQWKAQLPAGTTGAATSGEGIAWYRLAIELPEACAGRPASLRVEAGFHNSGFVNGTAVGSSGEGMPQPAYQVPAGTLHAGRNLIAIRVAGVCGGGGIASAQLLVEGQPPIDLAGRPWSWQLARPLDACAMPPYQPPHQRFAYCEMVMPTAGELGNAMVTPVAPFAFHGVVWYQGESNDNRGYEYRWLLAGFINDLRQQFRAPQLPVLVVQLPEFAPIRGREGAVTENSPWANLREAQLLACAQVPLTVPVVAAGLGDDRDIHPQHKEGLATRLAVAAMATVHGAKGPTTGPLFRSAAFADGAARIAFDQVGGGLMAADPALPGFALRSADGDWIEGKAVIDGEQVVVTAPGLAKPVAVRYQWREAVRASLSNREGLPASPFRSDR